MIHHGVRMSVAMSCKSTVEFLRPVGRGGDGRLWPLGIYPGHVKGFSSAVFGHSGHMIYLRR